MAELTQAEQGMFAKYWGRTDLVDDDGFWMDVLLAYQDVRVPLPIEFNPLTVRRLLDILDCPGGQCSACCHYPKTHIREIDVERILDNTQYTREDLAQWIKTDERGIYLDTAKGCPFLEENSCKIHKYRPDVCYLFPIQSGREVFLDNKPMQQIIFKIKCPQSVEIIRKILREALSKGERMLLPDLTTIPIYKEE